MLRSRKETKNDLRLLVGEEKSLSSLLEKVHIRAGIAEAPASSRGRKHSGLCLGNKSVVIVKQHKYSFFKLICANVLNL